MRRFDQREQHRERLLRLNCVTEIGRHVEKRAGFEHVNFVVEVEFTFAGENLNQRVLGGGVLAEFLPLGETEQDGARVRGVEDGAADDAVGGELGFVSESEDFGFVWRNERLFFHTP